jgi:CHAT domain-containing protein
MSFAEYWLADLAKARAHAEQARQLEEAGLPTPNLARTYNVLGLITKDDERFAEAARLFEKALELARATNDSDVLVRATGNLGLVAMNLGDTRRARENFREQRRLARAVGDTRNEGNSLANEANVDIWEGNPRPAIVRLDSARERYQRVGFATGQQYALTMLATSFEETGDVDAAFAVLDSALVLARRLGLKSQEAEVMRLLSEMHLRVGDYRRAVAYAETAESRMRAIGYEIQRPKALRDAATAYLRLGNLTRARADAEEAVRLDSIADARLDQLDGVLLLAEIDYRREGLRGAEPRLRTARALADMLGTRGSRIAVTLAAAHIVDAAHDSPGVLRTLRTAAPDIAAGDFAAEWETNALAARAYARLNALDSAVAAGRRAIAAVERLRGALASEALRSTYVADRAEVYSDLAVVLLKLGQQGAAFAVADAARSGALLRRLGAARDDARSGALPGELIEGQDLLRRIDDLVQRLRERERARRPERGNSADSADVALASQLDRARSEYEALTIRLAQARPRAATMLGSDTARVGEVRASLSADEALLDYLVTPDRVIVFVVRPEAMTVVQRPVSALGLTQRVRLLRDLWGARTTDWRWGLGASKALDDALVAPVRDAGLLAGVRRLFIVPHGVIAQVPFPALTNAKTGRFLVEDFAVTMLPSAGALPVLRRDATAIDRSAGGGVGFAPFPEELPATRGEVEAFRTGFPGAMLRLGRQATEAEVRRALTLGGPVHMATHAVINVRNPMFSRIELARPDDVRSENDGRLEVHELLGLGVRSPLVFLAGCETGAGTEWTDDPVRGTAELTLAQAFLSAGASNVVLTLWRIDDAGAGAFAREFYAALPRVGVDVALAEAQRRMAHDARYSHPFFWAGYLLAGAAPQEPRVTSVSVISRGLAGKTATPAMHQ